MAGQVITKIAANSGTHLISTSFYGTCATATGTAAKAVIINDTNITDAITLVNGMTLAVKFVASNSVANPTITVYNNSGTATAPTQGSTTLIAAKSIYQVNTNLNAAGTAASTSAATSWKAGATVIFVYDGQGWVEASSTYNQDNNTTYANHSFGNGYAYTDTAAATAAKTATFSSYALSNNGIVAVKFTNGNTVVNPSLNINSKGERPIYWRGAALTDVNLIRAGDIVTFVYSTVIVSTGVYEIIAISPSDTHQLIGSWDWVQDGSGNLSLEWVG